MGPSLAAGIQLGYPVLEKKVLLMGGADFMAIFERKMNDMIILFNIGAMYMF